MVDRGNFHRMMMALSAVLILVFGSTGAIGEQTPDTPKGQLIEAIDTMAPKVGEPAERRAVDVERWELSGTWTRDGDDLRAAGRDAVQKLGSSQAVFDLRLPALTSTSGRLILEFEERFSLESDYDFGVIRVSTDEGRSWIEIGRRTGLSDGRTSSVDLTTYAGRDVRVAFELESDDRIASEGWEISAPSLATYNEKAVNVSLVNINHSDFPHIFMNMSVRDDDLDITDLPDHAFSVYEDDVLQTGSFDVVAPDEGGGVRVADIVFVLDVTGSMSGEIASVRANMASFVTELAASSIDYRIGFVRYWDTVEVMNDGNLYADFDEIMGTINSFSTSGGGDTPENQLQAMVEATHMNYRPGALRVQIMLTDAYAHEADWATPWTVATTIEQLLASGSVVYPVFDTGNSTQVAQYAPVAEATNPDGSYYHIYNNFNGIITSIQESIAETYVVRYRTTNGALDGTERQVSVEVEVGGGTHTATGAYTPGAAPTIVRTSDTQALSERSWAELTPLTIAARVTDSIDPAVEHVTLYYRHQYHSSYYSMPMTSEGGDVYSADLPPSLVMQPGLRYYISASDGVNVATDPDYDPNLNAYSIGVLPNELPEIVFDPPSPQTLVPGEDIEITAVVTDETNMVEASFVSYRPVGEAVWNTLPMTLTGTDTYRAVIPGEVFDEEGVEVYLTARDDIGTLGSSGDVRNPYLLRAWAAGDNDLLVFNVRSWSGSAAANQVRLLGNLDTKAYDLMFTADIGADGIARFTYEDMEEMTSGLDEEIHRIELARTGPGGYVDILGHINFHYSSRNYEERKHVNAFLFLHDDGSAPRINDTDSHYAQFFSHHGGWEDYNPDYNEYLVSMLIPPEESIMNIDASGREPVVLVHGIYGRYPYWYDADEHMGDLDHSSRRRGGLAYHLDDYDVWSFYYPYDIRVPHASNLLGRAIHSLLSRGGISGTGEYSGGMVKLVAHSMGGLVSRGYLTGTDYADNVEKLLMYATPNHGSYSSFRMIYDGWSPTTGLADLAFKDRASPAHVDMAPGSPFLRYLDDQPLRDLETSGTDGDYMVIAGRDDLNFIGLFHDEILSQEDGVVAVSSASLLDKDIPLVIVDHNHLDLHRQFDDGRSIEFAEAFLGGGSSPDVSGLSSWYECHLEDLDDVSCSTVRDDVGMLDVEFPGVAVERLLVEVNGSRPERMSITADGGTMANPAQYLLRNPASGAYFGFLDYFIAVNEITWTPPERDFDVPNVGDRPYDLYFYRDGWWSDTYLGRISSALPTRHMSTVSHTVNLPDAMVRAMNGVGGAPLTAKAQTYDVEIDGSVSSAVIVLNYELGTLSSPGNLELFDPLGARWTIANTVGHPTIDMTVDDEGDGTVGYVGIHVEPPRPGTWTLRYPDELVVVNAESIFDTEIAGLLTVESEPELEPGEDLVVRVDVTHPEQLSSYGVTLEYSVVPGDESKMTGEIPLTDEGDGVYSGLLTVEEQGLYQLRLSLSGQDMAGGSIQRTDLASVLVGRAPSSVELEPGDIIFYPNPMNPEVDLGTIAFAVSAPSVHRLTILDTAGHKVVEHDLGSLPAGAFDTTWDGRDSRGNEVANGLYFGVVTNDAGDRLITKIAVLR